MFLQWNNGVGQLHDTSEFWRTKPTLVKDLCKQNDLAQSYTIK